MEKHKKLIIIFAIVIVSILTIYYKYCLAPYNLQGIRLAKELKDVPKISEYFKDYKINKIEYLGRDAYEVYTNKSEFLIIADYSDYQNYKYKIFKYDKSVDYFQNSM
jgi:hypothetical protein